MSEQRSESPRLTILLGVVLFILMVIIAGMLTRTSQPQPQAQSIRLPPVRITLAQFLRLEDGMSYLSVSRLLSKDGTEVSRSNLGGASTVMYQWQNEDGSNMNAMFQNDKLITKAQAGLK